MNIEQNEIFDEFQISLLIRKHGWSNIVLSLPEKTHTSTVTDIFSSVVTNILECCEAVVDNHQHTQPFFDEPGGAVWRFTPDPVMRHLVRVRIFELSDQAGTFSESDLTVPVVDFLAKRKHMLLNFMMELWRTKLLYADASFYKDRQEFPHGRFEMVWNKWAKANIGCPFLLPA
ncbi:MULTISPECIES: hypothetical protein [Brucella/Ochrobactrum group]|jgi:hypothetical protein|uniref:hypothetical protein n=1 Tax=Brucella/Ochrobactrum group TaxID=2826938 RepID=UPI001C055182|nr:hypothetical protein [Brucella sp. NBRC 12950]QWK80005.1 hypothetical protein KMS41_13920 [Ochrobactrum sp. BTU1]